MTTKTHRPNGLLTALLGILLLCTGCGDAVHDGPSLGDYVRIRKAAEASYLEEDLTIALDRIAGWLKEKAPKAAATLQAGLTNAKIDQAIEKAGFEYELPDDVRAIYRWRNGMQRGSSFPFVGPNRLLSLEEALEIATSDTLRTGYGLPAGSLPVLAGPDQYFYARCEARARKAVPIMFRERTKPIAKIRHTCLTSLFLAWGEVQVSGNVDVDPETGKQVMKDTDKWMHVQSRHSPELMQ